MIIALTGHRPNKLFGYNINTEQYYKLGRVIRSILIEQNATHIISGMALGADTIFALVGIKLRNTQQLTVECAIPCINHSSRWTESSRQQYDAILATADKITLVTNAPYSPHLMQLRNQYMVDNCDLLIAVWDGTSGGTGNCVQYANSIGKNIITINPKSL